MTEVKKHSEEFKFHTKLIPIVSQQFSAHTAGTDYYLTLPDTGTHVRAKQGALVAERYNVRNPYYPSSHAVKHCQFDPEHAHNYANST